MVDSKGRVCGGEDALEAAQREFHEETGFTAEGPFLELGAIKQAGGKAVTAWAFEETATPSVCGAICVKSNGRQVRAPD